MFSRKGQTPPAVVTPDPLGTALTAAAQPLLAQLLERAVPIVRGALLLGGIIGGIIGGLLALLCWAVLS